MRRLYQNEMDRAAFVHRVAFDTSFPWLAGFHTPDEDRDYFRDHVFAEYEVWGVLDREVIGFVSFRRGWIDQLYVLPEWQGRGAGLALLQVAKSASSDLRLWTFQQNIRARRFYERHGFVALRQTDGSNNEEREPDVLYQWERK